MNGNGNGAGGSLVAGSMILATFLKVNPPAFSGSTNPTEANNWEAQHWWQGAHRLLQQGNIDEAITWERFKEEFYKKYFPNSVRQAKELELLQLKQGSMTVAAYTSKFEELCRFSRVCQGAPEGYKEWKCMKYQDSLRDDIMRAVAPLEVKNFAELVNKSRVVEDSLMRNATANTNCGGNHGREGARYLAPRG
ncbi:uncharacterized protein LOC107647140 [Arachis ipaensis]|uniref:uncharacterized protein LOC107647140 n=1 Tax=Arachis ipaensis TaxID=130454 RepID=UPI0007AEEE24|nr:uncharacterized protein LOC107647140 [Arachis ipaensis]